MKNNFYYFSLLGQLGLIITINIGVCIGIYKLIEKFMMKSTFLFIFFLILGIASGFYSAYKLLFK
ncbi:MAG: hypothetical protein B6I28_04575 [Fusobacteriia bacterium 4572_132]|nr:MAG: hypothetical protein B6I28_04575 [Fusobacteriia bacterium 4572_132]